MTKVVFENATIADVINKAARIAPTKGHAFDTAAGIHMSIDPVKNEVIVRANNTEVFYMEVADVVSIEGDEMVWLLPSALVDGICSKLPVASGAQVTFEDKINSYGHTEINISHRRMKARLNTLDPSYYKTWEAFDPTDLSVVADFGARLQQVQWAASTANVPPLTGINLNGKFAAATDNYKVAITPCEAPMIYKPVTIPAATFTPLMKTLGEVRMGCTEQLLLVMPDESTQIMATIYANKYPPVDRALKRDETHALNVRRDELIDMIDQAKVMSGNDRTPMLKLIIGQEEVAVLMEDQEVGLLGNVMELPGQAVHTRCTIGLNPDNLLGALRASPNQDVTIFYHWNVPKKPVRIEGGGGYEVLISPRQAEKKE